MSYKWIPYTPNDKPLSEMSIALVTTAGVHLIEDPPFYDNIADPDTSFRIVPEFATCDQLTITHYAPVHEYDPNAVKQDINTVFPLDRLKELAAGGWIGRVSPRHYSFMGYMMRFHKLIKETLPPFIKHITHTNPDAVLLTAGCPYSHRTVVVIQRAIEAQGIPTVLITVDLDHSRNYRPPRAIHPLRLTPGHSTGFPHDTSQQIALIKTALTQLVTPQEPGTIHKVRGFAPLFRQKKDVVSDPHR